MKKFMICFTAIVVSMMIAGAAMATCDGPNCEEIWGGGYSDITVDVWMERETTQIDANTFETLAYNNQLLEGYGRDDLLPVAGSAYAYSYQPIEEVETTPYGTHQHTGEELREMFLSDETGDCGEFYFWGQNFGDQKQKTSVLEDSMTAENGIEGSTYLYMRGNDPRYSATNYECAETTIDSPDGRIIHSRTEFLIQGDNLD